MPFSAFAKQTADQTLRDLKTSVHGLHANVVNQRLEQHGANEWQTHRASWLEILWRQLATPFVVLLTVASIVSLALQQIQEGLLILLFIVINASLGFWQEYQSSKVLDALRHYIQPNCRVKRDDKWKTIPCRELVPGDIISVEAGDIVTADARIIETETCIVDESVLTGESSPVNKTTSLIRKQKIPVHEAKNILFSAARIVEGKATAAVFATGNQSMVGQIAKESDESARPSQFERGIALFSRFILKLVGATLTLILLANILLKGSHANPIELLVFSIALAVSVVPEALPLVMTISLSRGAMKLAKKNVVVKRLSAIEGLGGITVLCSDKTGTITENNLTVENVWGEDEHAVFVAAASGANMGFQRRDKLAINPFDQAIFSAIPKNARLDLAARIPQHELPFDPHRRRNSVLLQTRNGFELIVRGAPESILACCSHVDAKQKKALLTWMAEQGKQGCRVLAIAKRDLEKDVNDLEKEEHNLTLVGALSFFDPLKPSAKHAIKQASESGIKVKVLTGDSLDVARAIGRDIGLISNDQEAMTGDEFMALPAHKKEDALKRCHVFARVSPDQKHHLIQAYQRTDEVGFLGEGINDAPALKIADVGLAVQGASDVAREAADVILLNKSLDVIINGIIEGRAVFANTVKYIRTTLTSNFGNFYTVAIASLFIDFLPMLPIQILLVNLLSDFPMIAVSTDSVDPRDIQQPRKYEVREIILFATIMGIVSSVFDFFFFVAFLHHDQASLQTNWFIGSILTELALIFCLRTRRFFLTGKQASLPLVLLCFIAAAITLILPYSSLGQTYFHFQAPTAQQISITLGITAVYFLTSEITKLVYARSRQALNAPKLAQKRKQATMLA